MNPLRHFPRATLADWERRLPLIVLTAVTLLIVLIVGRYALNFATGSDESGYLNNARLLRTGALVGELRPVAGLPLAALDRGVYQPLGFGVAEDGSRLVPTYPMGFPLALAAVETLFGEAQGGWWLLVGLAGALPWLVYRLGCDLSLERPWAVLAALAVGVSPLTFQWGLRPMTDVFSTVLAVAALIAGGRVARGRGWGLLAGLLFSWAVLTRVPNGLLAIPLAVLLLAPGRRGRWWTVAVGAVPGALFFLRFNEVLYGTPLATGYSDLGNLFKWEYLGPTMVHFGRWIGVFLTPPLAVAFLLTPFRWRRADEAGRRALVVLWSWVVALVGFYAFYQFSHDGWGYLRFILPAFPAMAIGAAGVWQALAARAGRRWGRALPLVVWSGLIVLGGGWMRHWNHRLVAFREPAANDYVRVVQWTRTQVQPNDVLVCMLTSGCLYYYTPNPIARYEYLWAEHWPGVQAAARTNGVAIYAVLADFEYDTEQRLVKTVPGDWTQVVEFGGMRVYQLRL